MREATTEPRYRLWSIGAVHSAMLKVSAGGAAIALEVWRVPPEGLISILLAEPSGLSIGSLRLSDGEEVLGAPYLCEGQPEITEHGGWRRYLAACGRRSQNPGFGDP